MALAKATVQGSRFGPSIRPLRVTRQIDCTLISGIVDLSWLCGFAVSAARRLRVSLRQQNAFRSVWVRCRATRHDVSVTRNVATVGAFGASYNIH